ncbi:hypothetical protein OAJ14_02745 [Polaribacter sp.]|nr:hypothetical protein [Polaribacter sp.]
MNDNFQINFSLKGFSSVLVGTYFFITGYLIKTILEEFVTNDSPLGMLSTEIIEVFIITLIFCGVLFSSLALFFSGKRNAKKKQYPLWNQKTKTTFQKYILFVIVAFSSLILLLNLGFVEYLTPTFLIIYASMLFTFKNKARKNLLILAGLNVFLALICLLIPSYWFASFSILGIAHITYGVVEKN